MGPPGGPAQATWTFDPRWGWRLVLRGGSAGGLRRAREEGPLVAPWLDPERGPELGPELAPGEVAETRVALGEGALPPTAEWARELLQTYAALDAGQSPAIDPDRLPGPSLGELRALLDALPPAPPGFDLAQVPRDFSSFDRLMRQRLERPLRRLAAEVVGLPVTEAAFALWAVGQPERNEKILKELYPRVVGLMGGLLRFEPAPLAWPARPKAGTYGWYSFSEHAVVLNSALWRLPLQEALATLVHEQLHALQGEWIARLGLPGRPASLRRLRPLGHDERALALAWLWEFPKLQAHQQGEQPKDPEEARRRYRRFMVEHAAFFAEKVVVEACNEAHCQDLAWEGRLHHRPQAIAQEILWGRGGR